MSRFVDLDTLSAAELDELGALLREEAALRRRRLTLEQATEAWRSAPLSPGNEQLALADVLRIRSATRRLIRDEHWKPEQIVDAMLELALHVSPHPSIAEEAIVAGIADAES